MITKVIKYLFKTDEYNRENAGRILERIKSGEFDNERRNAVNQVRSDVVSYLYIDVRLIYMDPSRFTTLPKDDDPQSTRNQEDHGFNSWRFLYMMFEDGTEFYNPGSREVYPELKEYMETEDVPDDYIALEDIVL